jgi:hypothetical protein
VLRCCGEVLGIPSDHFFEETLERRGSMSDVEGKIVAFLREEADRATLSAGIYQSVLRRAKIRRVVTATAAGLAVIAIVMGGVVTAGALRSPSDIRPVAPEESPEPSSTPRENGDGVYRKGPEVVVAQGNVSGKSWTVIAYESNAGLCVEVELGAGRGGGCGFDVPEKDDLGLNVGSQAGLDKTIVHGVVSKRVAALVVRLDGGEESELEIIKGPSGFDVNFFAEFLPPNAKGIIETRDDQGAVLQRQRLGQPSEFGDQEPSIE